MYGKIQVKTMNVILFHAKEIDILIFLPSKDYPTFSIIKNRNMVTAWMDNKKKKAEVVKHIENLN
jgi:hypothetical protein